MYERSNLVSSFPRGLEHVLAVYRLVRLSHFDRLPAIREVARKRRVDFQTISSACTRSIGINTEEFEEFLLEESSERFREHLIRRFPDYQSEISQFFSAMNVSPEASDESERPLETLFPDEKQHVMDWVLLGYIRRRLSEWVDRSDIAEDVRNEMRRLEGACGRAAVGRARMHARRAKY